MKKSALVILLFTAFSAFTTHAQTPKTNSTKIYTFTGKQLNESIITSGEDYTPTAKLKTLQTKFGLDTDGRTESILMSMPPDANWLYNYQPLPGSKEAATLAYLRKDVDWIGVA